MRIALTPLAEEQRRMRGRSARLPPAETTLSPYIAEYDYFPSISNSVYRVNLGVPIHLRQLLFYFQNADYKPDKFASVAIHDMSSTCTFFPTGLILISGSKGGELAKAEAHSYRLLLEHIPHPAVI